MSVMKQTLQIAVKALIFNNKGQILIIHKSNQDEVNPNDYDIPWGRMQFGETAQEALCREIKEEVNIEIDTPQINRVRWYTTNNTQLVGLTFLAKYKKGKITLSFEHTHYARKTIQEILQGDFPERLKEEIKSIK